MKTVSCVARGAPKVVPGLVAAVAVATAGAWASLVLARDVLGRAASPISPAMFAIVLGLTIGNVLRLPSWLNHGIGFAVRRVLRLGVALLGIRLSFVDVVQLGGTALPVIVACVSSGLLGGVLLARRMGVPGRLGTLIGVGTSICGVSAVVAAAPLLEASDEEVTYAVAVITLFGTLATLTYPYIAHLMFPGDPLGAGLFLGTSIHDTSQVAGAALVHAEVFAVPRALDIAVVAKLIRNLFMAAVVPLVGLRRSWRGVTLRSAGSRGLTKVFPLFVIGFLALAGLRSIGDAGVATAGKAFSLLSPAAWDGLVYVLQQSAGHLVLVALAAIGLGTRLLTLLRFGAKPFAVGLSVSLFVGAVSYAVIVLVRELGWFGSLL